jgi:hypothetical protein
MSADQAAIRIAQGLARDLDVVAFPRRLAAAARGAALLPERLRRIGMHGFRFQIRKRR